MKRTRLTLSAAIVVLASVVWWSTPASLDFEPALATPQLPARDTLPNVIPGTEKRVRLYAGQQRTRWSIVYLHGFSATRQETAPLAERVAEQVQANLFETRYAGHGLRHAALTGVTAEDWLTDTAEALAAGAALGDNVIVIATSTGATLAAALLDHPLMQHVESLVFLSPNFGLQNGSVRHATGPGGRILTRLLAGKTRSWTAQNEHQALYWSTDYPSAALIEMVRVLDRAERKLAGTVPQRILMILAQDDQVVSAAAARAALQRIEARDERIIEVTDSGDRSMHILAGDIMSPQTTDDIVRQIVDFVRD